MSEFKNTMKNYLGYVLFVFMLSVFFPLLSSGQSLALSSDGKDFWVGYMYPSYNKVANPSTGGFYGAYLLCPA